MENKLLSKIIFASCLLIFFLLTGCVQSSVILEVSAKASYSMPINIKAMDKIPINLLITNPLNHKLEIKYNVRRGTIIQTDNSTSTFYYAPFTSGRDLLTISIFDKTTNMTLPNILHPFEIQSETIAYVDLANRTTPLKANENGLIKIEAFKSIKVKKDIGLGRTPTISPNGKYIAYVRYFDNYTSQIIVQDIFGNEIKLTDDKSLNLDPAWSPINTDDKLSIVFSSNRNNDNKKFHLWKIRIDTRELTQLTKEESNDTQPDWSPDGKAIVFVSNLDDNIEKDYTNLYILETSTNTRMQITHENQSGFGVSNPVWSPFNQKIVFSRKYQYKLLQKTSEVQKIWIYDYIHHESVGFGQVATKNYDESIIETFPSWEPDGTGIIFVRSIGSENSLISLLLTEVNYSSIVSNIDTIIDKVDINNITEAKWARQGKSYITDYNNGATNPFIPTPTGSP